MTGITTVIKIDQPESGGASVEISITSHWYDPGEVLNTPTFANPNERHVRPPENVVTEQVLYVVEPLKTSILQAIGAYSTAIQMANPITVETRTPA